jgi:hypothetical protein
MKFKLDPLSLLLPHERAKRQAQKLQAQQGGQLPSVPDVGQPTKQSGARQTGRQTSSMGEQSGKRGESSQSGSTVVWFLEDLTDCI